MVSKILGFYEVEGMGRFTGQMDKQTTKSTEVKRTCSRCFFLSAKIVCFKNERKPIITAFFQ